MRPFGKFLTLAIGTATTISFSSYTSAVIDLPLAEHSFLIVNSAAFAPLAHAKLIAIPRNTFFDLDIFVTSSVN